MGFNRGFGICSWEKEDCACFFIARWNSPRRKQTAPLMHWHVKDPLFAWFNDRWWEVWRHVDAQRLQKVLEAKHFRGLNIYCRTLVIYTHTHTHSHVYTSCHAGMTFQHQVALTINNFLHHGDNGSYQHDNPEHKLNTDWPSLCPSMSVSLCFAVI